MARYLHLKVPSSCQEKWHRMAPEQKGRYCFSCQNPVVDFTGMSDSELLAYFKEHGEAACGRFTESQLNRDIPFARRPLPWIKHFVRFSLPAFLLSLKSSAQVQKADVPVEITSVRSSMIPVERISGDSLVLNGVVTDEGGVPLSYATIQIKGTHRGMVCNEQGQFTFANVPASAVLVISLVGFESKEVKAATLQQAPAVKLQLHLHQVLMGAVVVVHKKPKKKKRNEESESHPLQHATSSILPYPNPVMAGSTLHIRCQNLERGEYSCELYALPGQLMQSAKLTYGKKENEMRVSIASLPAGTYLLRLTHGRSGKQFRQQVVVKN